MPSSLLGPGGAPIGVAAPPVPAVPDPTTPIEVTTAFVVYQMPIGGWEASPLDVGEPVPDRDVTFDDMTAAAACLLDNLDVHYREGEYEVITAFVVFQLPNGLWQIAPKVDAPLIPERKATKHDIRGGLAVTARDVHTQEIAQMTAQATINAQMQLGQAVQQQRQQAMVQQQIEADKDAQRRRGGR